ncbi:MAG: hypothetical protein H6751_03745 [Candidatus Omnitrophica bacterium]|nr:hypothetical protein [Candidatus Omnitrophota bacterium]
MIYYVNKDTIVQPPMREVTDEEMNRPPAFMMPQQQQQPQQSGSFLGRLFGN